jgi:hypothetical protein
MESNVGKGHSWRRLRLLTPLMPTHRQCLRLHVTCCYIPSALSPAEGGNGEEDVQRAETQIYSARSGEIAHTHTHQPAAALSLGGVSLGVKLRDKRKQDQQILCAREREGARLATRVMSTDTHSDGVTFITST